MTMTQTHEIVCTFLLEIHWENLPNNDEDFPHHLEKIPEDAGKSAPESNFEIGAVS